MPAGEIAVIAVTAGVGAVLTSVAGLGGGMLLLAVMLAFVDPVEAVALHGVVQLISNGSRTVALRDAVAWPMVGRFVAPLLPAALIGYAFAGVVPADAGRLVIAAFALTAAWHPAALRFLGERKSANLVVYGAGAGFAQMTLGAVGPAIVGVFRYHLGQPQATVATFSACQFAAHLAKVAVFGITGFAFAANAPLLAWAGGATVLGTWVGTSLLRHLNDTTFRWLFQLAITAAAANIVVGVVVR